MHAPRGMTLIEVVMVLVIIGLIAAISIRSLAPTFRRSATRAASDQFITAHRLARSTAVRYGRLAEFHIEASSGRFWIEVDTSAAGVQDTIGMRDVTDGPLAMTSNRSLLCFDARGLPATRQTTQGENCEGPDAQLIFAIDSRADTVVITALGKVLR
jgi:prepilin-type N-terminal cleavage/methylation domain-containing protein